MESWRSLGGLGSLVPAPCECCSEGVVLSGPWECPHCQLVIAVTLAFALDRDGGHMACPNCEQASRILVDPVAANARVGHG